MTLRVAVIGAGIMGADHAKIVAQDIPGASLHVLCDPDADKVRQVGETLGATDISTDAAYTVTRDDVDAVLVSSPDHTHADLTIAAITAGKPVLCEKPLAPTAADCVPMIKAEVAQGRRMVWAGFMRRFDPAYTAMRATRDSGQLGSPVMMHNIHRNVEAPDWFSGHMAITNSASHEFDIIRFILDTDPVAITAYQANNGEAIPPIIMVLQMDAGQIVTIEMNNNATYGYDVRGELIGTKGTVELGTPVNARMNLGLAASHQFAPDWRPRFAEAYRLQNKAWVDSIITGTPNPTAASLWDGYCAALIGEAGVISLDTGGASAVTLPDRPALYDR